jgi:phosphonate transport system substrate-binding protein
MKYASLFTVATAAALASVSAYAQLSDACTYRGDLDPLYCDENRDLVAESPKDSTKWRDPSTLVFAYTPIEDPAVYQNVFKHFTEYFAACTSKKVVYFNVQNNAAQIEAMRAGRLHVSGLSSGQTGFAVNLAGAVPFAIKGSERGPRSYQQVVIVKRDSPFQKLSDLKGKKVAHVSPSSNSGHLAPLVLFPKEDITPGKDYNIVFSGKHDQSLAGVLKGDYDAAPITSDLIERWVGRGHMKADDVRIIYRSQNFPTTSFAYAHDLNPALATKIKQCFFEYRFPPEMKKEFLGEDRFVPVDYKRDWEIVREITKASGASYTRNQFDRENKPAP